MSNKVTKPSRPAREWQRLNALSKFIEGRGFTLGGEGLQGEGFENAGHTVVWDQRSGPPVEVPGSLEMVEAYAKSKETAEQFHSRLLAMFDNAAGPSPEEQAARLQAVEQEIHDAVLDLSRNSWRVGDKMNEYAALRPDIRSNDSLSEKLNLGLTGARVGQLRNTSAFFPDSLRDSSIAFELYNLARAAGGTKFTAAHLAAVVKENPTIAAVSAALKPESNLSSHSLRLTVTVKDVNGKPTPKVTVSIDGTAAPEFAFAPEHQAWLTELVTLAMRETTILGKRLDKAYPEDGDEGGTAQDEPSASKALSK